MTQNITEEKLAEMAVFLYRWLYARHNCQFCGGKGYITNGDGAFAKKCNCAIRVEFYLAEYKELVKLAYTKMGSTR